MSKHKVLKAFTDKFTDVVYSAGHIYESDNNERVVMLQELGYLESTKQETQEEMKHVGAGYYLLPNGEKVRGTDKALDRLMELNKSE